MAGILIEGVTGSGKTQTLQALKQHREFSAFLGSGRVFEEDETFGQVMAELQEPGISIHHLIQRLERVLIELERGAASPWSAFTFFGSPRPFIEIDTGSKSWNTYAGQIVNEWGRLY